MYFTQITWNPEITRITWNPEITRITWNPEISCLHSTKDQSFKKCS